MRPYHTSAESPPVIAHLLKVKCKLLILLTMNNLVPVYQYHTTLV